MLESVFLMAHLNIDTSVVFLITTGRALHSRGPAQNRTLSLRNLFSDARYAKLAGVGESEPTVAKKHQDSGSLSVMQGELVPLWRAYIHHQAELVTNPISER